MPSRPFAFNNTGVPIPGTEQIGSLAIGYPTAPFESLSVKFWNGPEEYPGAIIVVYPDPSGSHTGADGTVAYLGCELFTNPVVFMGYVEKELDTTPTDPEHAKTLLNNAGIWTNYGEGGGGAPSAPVGYDASLYTSYTLIPSNDTEFFNREISTRSVKIYLAAEIGGQLAVPDAFGEKVARAYQLLLEPNVAGVDNIAQSNTLRNLAGTTGPHVGMPTMQRVAYGGGADYDPNFLANPNAYTGLEALFDSTFNDDMVWYLNSTGEGNGVGDRDAAEVLEHVMHTIHMGGIVTVGSGQLSISSEADPFWNQTELYAAMSQAIDKGFYQPTGIGANWASGGDAYKIAVKEYLYLLNFGMHEYTSLWDNGTLAPEWHDSMKTPFGIQTNNALGYALWNTYFEASIAKVPVAKWRSIFQDGDIGNPLIAGDPGYVAD